MACDVLPRLTSVCGNSSVELDWTIKKIRFSTKKSYQMSRSSLPAGRRVYQLLKSQIEDGVLASGERLPSTRSLASELGVSRSTVVAMYEQLAAEGYIETSPGARARVASGIRARTNHPGRSAAPARRRPRLSSYGQRVSNLRLPSPSAINARNTNFLYGALAGQDFPKTTWRKVYSQVLLKRQGHLYYCAPEGEPELRDELRAYLLRARGLTCTSDQIVIVQGSQQALDLCARVLLNLGDKVVFEDPGYWMARQVFETAGATVVPTKVDEQGLVTDHLHELKAALAYVTPSHQFPLGSVMSISRRQAMLAWAKESAAWVIEDDYDSEFRYGLKPTDTLQSLDEHGTVIYVGTFSKALSPQIRLGYLVLPTDLVKAFTHAKQLLDRHAPRMEQQVLAEIIRSGAYERHIRRMRRENDRRRSALLEAIGRYLSPDTHVEGTSSGLHVVVWLPLLPPSSEADIVREALSRGVGVWPVSPFFSSSSARERRPYAGLILGYGGLEPSQINQGVKRLSAAVANAQQMRVQTEPE